jgi:nitroreductase
MSALLANWRSVRRYKDEPVPDQIISVLLEAARRAPSWENVQPWHFVAVRDPGTKEKLSKLALNQKQVLKAPVVIACFGDLCAWNRERCRKSLVELREAGVVPASDEVIDKHILTNPVLTPELLGKNVVLARTLESLSYAVAFMCVEAVNQGLGCCVIGAFGNEITGAGAELYSELRGEMAVPEGFVLMVLLPLGVPAEQPKARPRKALGEIASVGKFGRQWNS